MRAPEYTLPRISNVLAPDHVGFYWNLFGKPGGLAFGTDYHQASLPDDLLARFAELANASEDEILRFAQRYGVLGLCEHHQLPVGHKQGCRLSFLEPVGTWRALARAAGALSGSRLRFSAEQWPEARWLSDELHIRRENPKDSSDRKRFVREIINDWLRCASVRPRMNSLGIFTAIANDDYPSLFGPLAVALAQDFSIQKKWAICVVAGCHKRFSPAPNASPDRRHYCETCRSKNAALADAQRDYRRRKQEARQLYQAGRSPKEIAKRLSVRGGEPTVRRWL